MITTIAGGYGDRGQATAAALRPAGIAVDKFGNTYFIDKGNNVVRKITPAGIISTFAGTGTNGYSGAEDRHPAINAKLTNPADIACDSIGNVYIADRDNAIIRKVDTFGIITTFAGGGSSYYGNGIQATAASLGAPAAVTVDKWGNLFYTDGNRDWVRKVTPAGLIYTVAGNNSSGYSGDGGAATSAQLNSPGSITVDKYHNLYIVDQTNRIRVVDSTGIIRAFAGNGSSGHAGDGGQATAAVFNGIGSLTTDTAGNLFICDYGNNIIRKVGAGNIVTRVAGIVGTGSFAGDGGMDTSARFNGPAGIAMDRAGNYYVGDYNNNRIRKINPTGIVNTFAGSGIMSSMGFMGDGGPAMNAKLNNPSAVALDTNQNIYVADMGNFVVRKIATTGVITTIAGNGTVGNSGNGGMATTAQLTSPVSVATDRKGNIYICDIGGDRIRRVDNSGIITTYAGTNVSGFSGDGGNATAARLSNPNIIATDKTGNLYISDRSNYRIRKVDTNGVISTIAGTGTSGYFGDGSPATNAWISGANGMAVDDSGNIYFTDLQRVRKISTSGIISTFAGLGTYGNSGDGGPATAAQFINPAGVAIDKFGNVYVHDNGNGYIRKINPSGIISKFAGNGSTGNPSDGFPVLTTAVNSSIGYTTDSSGDLIIPNGANNRIYKIFNSISLGITANHDTICFGSPVTFSATYASHSAITPSYEWIKNGVIVGTDSASYTTTSLTQGDVVECRLHNGSGGGIIAVSDSVTVYVQTNYPSVSISFSPNDTVCAGTTVTFTAIHTNGGTAPTYDWYKNGSIVPGITGNSYNFVPVTADVIKCRLHSNMTCRMADTVTSASVSFTVLDTVTASVTITTNPGDTLCGSTNVTCTTNPVNSSASSRFTWYVNGTKVSGVTSGTYTYHPTNNQVLYCIMTKNGTCATDTAVAPSHTFVVNPKLVPTISITSDSGLNIKAGKVVTCSANITTGGTAPIYKWYKNGTLVYTGYPYTFTPAINDAVYCRITSNWDCLANPDALSNELQFVVDTSTPPPPAIPADAGIYPNPNDGNFYLTQPFDGPDGMDVYLTISTILGKVLHKETLIVNNKRITASFVGNRQLPEGIYMLSLATFTEKKVLRFVVKY